MADTAHLFHRFVSAKSQSPNNTIVSKNEWNDGLELRNGSNGQVLMYDSSNATYKSIFHTLPVIDITAPPYNLVTGGANQSGVIADAIAALSSAGGGTILLPAGVINFGATITGISNLCIIGQGLGITILRQIANSNLVNCLSFTSKINIIMRDFSIDMNRTSNTTDQQVVPIALNSCTTAYVERDEVYNVQGHTISPPSVMLAIGGTSRRIWVDGCYIHDGGTFGVSGCDAIFASAREMSFTRNRLEAYTDTGIAFEAKSTSALDPDGNTSIANNMFVCPQAQAIAVSSLSPGTYMSNVVVDGNVIKGGLATNGSSIRVAQGVGSGLHNITVSDNNIEGVTNGNAISVEAGGRNIKIVDNVMDDISAGFAKAGILCVLVDELTVCGNTVRGCGGNGIQVVGCTDFLINDNNVLFNGQALTASTFGIYVGKSGSTESVRGVIDGNRSGGSPQGRGIAIVDASDDIIIGVNNVEDNASSGYLITTTGTNIVHTALLTRGSFTATGTGFSGTDPTVTVHWRKIDDLVFLEIPQITGTSDADTFVITGLPAAIVPTVPSWKVVRVADNGTAAFGLLLFGASDDFINVYPSAAAGLWTASGTKTLQPTEVVYSMRV